MDRTPTSADAIVIGAGAFGASVTFYLASLGKRVCLIDRADTVSQTSPRAAGQAMNLHVDDHLSRIGSRSISTFVNFADEVGEPLKVHQTGSVKAATSAATATQIHDELARGRSLGFEIVEVDEDEAMVLAPWFVPVDVTAMWYSPADLYLEPGDLPRAYVRGARDIGATILPHMEVMGFETDGGAVQAVRTARGTIEAPVVVNAAGAWARQLCSIAGYALPLWPVRHQLCITAPIPTVAPNQPSVRIADARTYTRPAGTGLMFGAYEEDPLPFDPGEAGPGFDIPDLPLAMDVLEAKMREVQAQIPALPAAPIAELRGGLPTMTPDGLFIVDEVPSMEGMFVLTGCNVAGLSTSPALGSDLATWIVTGQAPADLAPYRLDRFAAYDDALLQELCCQTYSHKYSADEVTGARL